MIQAKERQTVLVVDDEPLNIRVLGNSLIDKYNVKTATCAEKTLEILFSKEPPDLVLLDVQLPDIDGYQICQKLKADHRTKNIPVIFLTGHNTVEDEAYGLEIGAVDYITKPFNIPIVIARVRNQLLLKQKTDLLEQLVSLDGLTEIHNRRFFETNYAREWSRLLRSALPCTVIMIDIDLFKAYNDNYGHHAGDDCLKAVANCLETSLKRGADFVARYGGEEFVAVLGDADSETANAVANMLRTNVEALKIPHEHRPDADSSYVTVSIGAATAIPGKKISSQELIDEADKNLYKAKKTGRNKVVCSAC